MENEYGPDSNHHPSSTDVHDPGLSCAHEIESTDRQVERELAEFHASCLSPARPAYSPAHTDCVLSR